MSHYLEQALSKAIEEKNTNDITTLLERINSHETAKLDAIDEAGNNFIHQSLSTYPSKSIDLVFDFFEKRKKYIFLFFQKNKAGKLPLDLALANKNVAHIIRFLILLDSEETKDYQKDTFKSIEEYVAPKNMSATNQEFVDEFLSEIKDNLPEWIQTNSVVIPFALSLARKLSPSPSDVVQLVNASKESYRTFEKLSEENMAALVLSGLNLYRPYSDSKKIYDVLFEDSNRATKLIESLFSKLDVSDVLAVQSVYFIYSISRKLGIQVKTNNSSLRMSLISKFMDKDFSDKVPLKLGYDFIDMIPAYKERLILAQEGKNEADASDETEVDIAKTFMRFEEQTKKVKLSIKEIQSFQEEIRNFLSDVNNNYQKVTPLYKRRVLMVGIVLLAATSWIIHEIISLSTGRLLEDDDTPANSVSRLLFILLIAARVVTDMAVVVSFLMSIRDVSELLKHGPNHEAYNDRLYVAQLPCYTNPEHSIYSKIEESCETLTEEHQNDLDNFLVNLNSLEESIRAIKSELADELRDSISELNEIKSSESIAVLHEALQTLISPDGILTKIAAFLNANQVNLKNDDGVAWQFYKPAGTRPHTAVEIFEVTDDRSDDDRDQLLGTGMESSSARI